MCDRARDRPPAVRGFHDIGVQVTLLSKIILLSLRRRRITIIISEMHNSMNDPVQNMNYLALRTTLRCTVITDNIEQCCCVWIYQ